MPLDPSVRVLLDQIESMGQAPMSEMSPGQFRQLFEAFKDLGARPEQAVPTEDRTIPGPAGEIPVRIYRPESVEPLGMVVFFHGGGFVIGTIATHDPLCQQIAASMPAVVVSVDYRLAPEHPFPAAVEDCLAATAWVSQHAAELGGESGRLAVAGDSAGGNLSAVVSVKARDAGGPPIAFQLLIYPATDLTRSSVSHIENGEGYLLTSESMDWFSGHYLGDGDLTHPDASPLFVEDLSGLPPAMVITAEFDPLRDEGEAYAERLRQAGVDARSVRYDGMIHGFVQFDAIVPAAHQAIEDAVTALREALTPATV
jgi:acetyl esterase